jgi:CBS-domain-containing membrane protein
MIHVKDVHGIHGLCSITMPQDASLMDIIRKFASEPNIRGLFLVDDEQRFAGMVSRLAILKWAEFQLKNKLKHDNSSPEIRHIIDTVKAKNLARGDWKSFGVYESDTLEEAFKKMMDAGEDILPVLDDNHKIIGDLRLSEVLQKIVDPEA